MTGPGTDSGTPPREDSPTRGEGSWGPTAGRSAPTAPDLAALESTASQPTATGSGGPDGSPSGPGEPDVTALEPTAGASRAAAPSAPFTASAASPAPNAAPASAGPAPSPAPDRPTPPGAARAIPTPGRSSAGSRPPRVAPERVSRQAPASSSSTRQRRARLRLQRIDPWSVFVLALIVSLFLAVVLVVAVVALYAVLQAAGVPDSVNELVAEVTRNPGEAEPAPLLSASRALTTAGVVAVVDVVLLTALATLSAVLYNLCASFTGGLEVTLAERDER